MKCLADEIRDVLAENASLKVQLAAAENKISQLVDAALNTEATLDALTEDALNTGATISEMQESIDYLTVDALTREEDTDVQPD